MPASKLFSSLTRRGLLQGLGRAAALGIAYDVRPALARSSWVIDPKRTHISFAVDAVAWPRTKGEFQTFDGRISVDFANPSRSSVKFKVETGSVMVNSDALASLLRGPAFLDSGKFPEATFVSTHVEKLDEHNVRVDGNLTLLGITKPATFDVAVDRTLATNGRLGFKVTGTIRRSDFGMTAGLPLIEDIISLVVTTEAGEQAGG